MSIKKSYIIIPAIAVLIIVGCALFFFFSGGNKEFQLIPKERTIAADKKTSGTEVGTGWSDKFDAQKAVEEAVAMALQGKAHKQPDMAVIFVSSGSDLKPILSEARKLLGNKTKIYGGTSDSRAVLTDKGFIKVGEEAYLLPQAKSALAIMTVTSEDIVFGVGSASFSAYPSVQEASKAAVLKAIQSAGKSPQAKPQAILITPTRSVEEKVIEGIEAVTGKNTVILGGTTGGPKWAVFGDNEVYEAGISLTVIYTHLPLGWIFEGGFEVRDAHAGIVTKVDGRAIVEIDHRPAVDVYDEWLGGKLKKMVKEIGDERKIRSCLILDPLYRRYTSSTGQNYFLFSHPYPKDKTLKDKSIMTSTDIKVGEKVYLSHGTWEKFLNRIGNLPVNARIYAGINPNQKPILGIGYICSGIIGVIPGEERDKIPLLMNYAHKNTPFIANITWGEQGYFPGVGNKHGNLLTSFLVIAEKE